MLEAVQKAGEGDNCFANDVIVFFSHRWKRPNWCEAQGKDLMWGTPERIAAEREGLVLVKPCH